MASHETGEPLLFGTSPKMAEQEGAVESHPYPYTRMTSAHLQVTEGHLWLNHPELCQVPAGMAVLRPEGWPKGVDVAETACKVLPLQLTRHSQEGRLAKEVLRADTAATSME